ncbi:aquaporin AQPAe.a-like [Physella acuta]|uniref:aquaporin AQPAe.a-like n=1 Tax=Physella acuta TaxID=109671 RepID=UPI0027DAFB77|nr:aquaporin AQPAe.a-like [Physella acuta]
MVSRTGPENAMDNRGSSVEVFDSKPPSTILVEQPSFQQQKERAASVVSNRFTQEEYKATQLTTAQKTYGAQMKLGKKISRLRLWAGGFMEFTKVNFYRQLVTEFYGTFVLVSVGCCVITPVKPQGTDAALDMASIILGWGFIVASLVWTIAHVSGCFLNPAVTVAMFVNRRITFVRCVAFIMVQVPGATCGSFFHKFLRGDKLNTTCQTLLNRDFGVTEFKGFIVEFFLTFLLLFFVFATTDHNRQDHGGSHAMMVGGVIIPLVNVGAELTGAGMNPARSFGPAFVHGNWDAHYIYWVAPILGGVCGGLFYDLMFSERVISWHRYLHVQEIHDEEEEDKDL